MACVAGIVAAIAGVLQWQEMRAERATPRPDPLVDGRKTVLGMLVSEGLVTNLFMIGGLDIVERSMLDKVLGEVRLDQTGLIDSDTAKKVGQLVGVDAIVTGSIAELQSYVTINCRLIDARTGRVFSAAQTNIVKDDDLRKAMGSSLAPERQPTGSPAAGGAQRHPSAQVQETEGFRFVLNACRASGGSVTCDVLITNEGADREISLEDLNSRLFDEDGNQYIASNAQLGGSASQGRSLYSRRVKVLAVSRVPVKMEIIFSGVSTDAQQATAVELAGEIGRIDYRVQFRDVVLVRR